MGEGLRIVFAGTAEFAVPTLRALAAGRDGVAAVFTRPDRPAGRGRRLRASPVKVAAQALGLAVLQPERVSEGEGLERLRELSPDLVFVVALGEILRAEALGVPRIGAVNLHGSLLPRYRGAAHPRPVSSLRAVPPPPSAAPADGAAAGRSGEAAGSRRVRGQPARSSPSDGGGGPGRWCSSG